VLTLCKAELVSKYSWLFTMNLINKNIYSHRTVKISNLLNRLLHEILGFTLSVVLWIFFCGVNTCLLLCELPQKIIHSRVKVGKIN
jgi:hypothetical protein